MCARTWHARNLDRPKTWIALIMPRKRVLKLHCPICKKVVKSADAEFPFCSDRCRTKIGQGASVRSAIHRRSTHARSGRMTPEDQDEE